MGFNPFPELSNEYLKPRCTPAQVRMAIEQFNQTGHSSHSSRRSLLPYVMRYCEEMKIPYTLQAEPGAGYYIERMKVPG